MNKKAFTLVELLAVISIIAILGVITVPNVLEYFHESKIKAMLVQENKLVESGDILVRDYCKKPINDKYRLECDDNYQSLENMDDEAKIDDDPLTYTRYICVSTLKDKKYYSEKLQYSGEDCSGVVVYRIDEETDIQKDSFAVVKCGTSYKTIFENENNKDYEEFLNTETRADELEDVFKDCFTEQSVTPPPETKKEYQLTINFTEHNQYGQQVAETISEKVLQGNSVTKNVPPYYSYDGTNEEHFTPFVHGSSDDVLNNSGNKVKPTIVDNKLNFKMPANNVTINIAYSINQYTVTFNHIDAVLGTSTIGGQNYNSNSYKLFNGESVNIPYKEIPNFKIVSHNKVTQTNYLLNEHNDKTIDIKYQQINFNVTYDSNGGTACATVQKEYKKNFGTLCTTTRTGYTFEGWYLDGTKVTSETMNNTYDDITLRANWTANEYQITYYMGNENGTTSEIGTSKCIYDSSCTLKAFSEMSKPFPYSREYEQLNIDENPSYGWRIYGWMTSPTTTNPSSSSKAYDNSATFTYNVASNLKLYALGHRYIHINGGEAPIKSISELHQYWNPYQTGDSYVSNVTLPQTTALNSTWTFIGYKAGSNTANSTVTFAPSKIGTAFKAKYDLWPYVRSVYERPIKLSYDANTGSGSVSTQSNKQYYNSGYGTDNKNTGANITTVEFTLANNGFAKTGYTFKNWAIGSKEGTKQSQGSTYSITPAVSSNQTEIKIYAIWDRNKYYVAYDCNAGTGTMSKSEHEYDVAKQLSPSACKKGGSVFVNWNTKADNSGTSYTDKQSVINLTSDQNKNITLFAQYSMCAAGTYAAAGATSCTSCPAGYTSLANSDSISDCYLITTAGKYVATANNDQTTCAADGYCPGNVEVKYGSTGGRTACASPYNKSDSGSDARADCYLTTTAGNYVATATSAQTACAANGYCPGNVTIYYNSTGGRTDCPANYANSSSGSDAASDCYLKTTAGKYVATATSAQTTCAANGYCPGNVTIYYNSTGGRTDCPANYANSSSGSDARADCYLTTTAGNYVATANSTQTQCTAGNYCTGGINIKYGETGGINVCPSCQTSSAGANSCYAITYTVSYDANGGSNPPGNQTKTCGTNLTLSSSKPTRNGYEFTGWKATNGTAYASGATYSANEATTMTAQWVQAGTKFGEYLLTQKGSNYLSSTPVGDMYRYQGLYTQVTKNYVCFGTSDKQTCLDNKDKYMYRVLGVNTNNEPRLIKYEPIQGSSSSPTIWNSDASQSSDVPWKNSDLKKALNGSKFYTNTTFVPSGWSDRIASSTWYYANRLTGSSTAVNGVSMYNTEKSTDSTNAYIGIMNISDWYLTVGNSNFCNEDNNSPSSPCKESWLNIYYVNNSYYRSGGTQDDWTEWTMSRYGPHANDGNRCYGFVIVSGDGFLTNDFARVNNAAPGKTNVQPSLRYNKRMVRPMFNLTEDTLKKSGTGTISDPYILLP